MWLVVLDIALTMTIDISIDAIGQLLFMKKFKESESMSDVTIEVASLTLLVLLVPTGLFVEKYGRRMALSIFVAVLFVVTQSTLVAFLLSK